MVKLSALVLSGIFVAAALPTHAAYQAYMQATGVKQGPFKGASRSKAKNIPVIQYTMTLGAGPQPITVVIEGADGTEFSTAVMNKEGFTRVIIQVIKPATVGKVTLLEKITLVNASIKTMTQSFDSKGAPLDTITFNYKKIDIVQGTGKVQAVDDWMLGGAKTSF